ncbi:unnamed protein product [Rangifer tarandus platyrhynchus]|uniref:Uncharacterized protein n=2 Tax=Rangifer tarandus platyrhynchus TaxID=3082113 RepID=A0ABN8YBB0_RANTA|nr:unnamed protein product [Rangifer tarandus platyrhynchus]
MFPVIQSVHYFGSPGDVPADRRPEVLCPWGQTLTGILHFLHACSVMSIPCEPVDSSPPGSSVHGILQARTLEWGACPSPGIHCYARLFPTPPLMGQLEAMIVCL